MDLDRLIELLSAIKDRGNVRVAVEMIADLGDGVVDINAEVTDVVATSQGGVVLRVEER